MEDPEPPDAIFFAGLFCGTLPLLKPELLRRSPFGSDLADLLPPEERDLFALTWPMDISWLFVLERARHLTEPSIIPDEDCGIQIELEPLVYVAGQKVYERDPSTNRPVAHVHEGPPRFDGYEMTFLFSRGGRWGSDEMMGLGPAVRFRVDPAALDTFLKDLFNEVIAEPAFHPDARS